MKQYLKEYQVVLHTICPVFVGNGKEIGKKEYVFLNKNLVGILDIQRWYGEMQRRGKAEAFEKFLLYNYKDNLAGWLRSQNIERSEIKPFVRYTLSCDDVMWQKGRQIQVMECIKDAYGMPYIPGTSLKGMFRTILLAEDILQNDQYGNEKQSIRAAAEARPAGKINRNRFLKDDVLRLEAKAYRVLGRENTKPTDAVNDHLQGFIVSDSDPLTEEDLALCQSIELHTDGTSKSLPMLRECIKPGRDIRFTITVDTQICPVSEQTLMQAVQRFAEQYEHNFAKAFSGAAPLQKNCVLLGGGCGFVSKTVVYPLYGKKDGIEVTKKIFEKTGVPRAHKHERDTQYGASPHILKCTHYKGKTMQMGLCEISVEA